MNAPAESSTRDIALRASYAFIDLLNESAMVSSEDPEMRSRWGRVSTLCYALDALADDFERVCCDAYDVGYDRPPGATAAERGAKEKL